MHAELMRFERAALSADENYMDLAALVARNSLCTGGHMGCVLVKVPTRERSSRNVCSVQVVCKPCRKRCKNISHPCCVHTRVWEKRLSGGSVLLAVLWQANQT